MYSITYVFRYKYKYTNLCSSYEPKKEIKNIKHKQPIYILKSRMKKLIDVQSFDLLKGFADIIAGQEN